MRVLYQLKYIKHTVNLFIIQAEGVIMRVSIAVNGRFHAFDLARQLERFKIDYKMVSSYYTREDLNNNIKLYPFLTYGSYFFRKIGIEFFSNLYEKFQGNLFPFLAAKQIAKWDSDIAHIFAGLLYSASKEFGREKPRFVLDWGSTHYKFGEAILNEEYKLLNLKKTVPTFSFKNHPKEHEIADCIVVPSKFVYDTFIDNGVDCDKIRIVPFGVDIPKLTKKEKDDEFRVLFVGGNTFRKGLHYLIQAVSELNLPKCKMSIVGIPTGEVMNIANKYPGNYEFLGSVSRKKLETLYKTSSVFVLPTLEEGSARVVYEAMAYGLPCIVSTNAGAVTRDGKDGFIIPIRDVKAIKEKILYFYENDSERERMSRNAREYIKNFTWDVYGERMVKLYKSLL